VVNLPAMHGNGYLANVFRKSNLLQCKNTAIAESEIDGTSRLNLHLSHISPALEEPHAMSSLREIDRKKRSHEARSHYDNIFLLHDDRSSWFSQLTRPPLAKRP